LPPRTSSPETYAAGLEHFAAIFFTFESIWDKITSSAGTNNTLEDTWESLDKLSASTASAEADAVISFLRTLRPLGISRSERLHLDLARLDDGRTLEATEQMRGEALSEFLTHIREVVREKPHVLVAYAWTMYMAVFSGGRWIRSQLCGAGEEFWTGSPPPTAQAKEDKVALDMGQFEGLGLSFWFFPGSQDGEDIKAAFKHRLEEGEHIFTPEQRGDIVAEAQDIFTRCDALVHELDRIHARAVAPRAEPAAGRKKKTKEVNWLGMPSYAGLALVVSCVSWYAMYHAGTWS
jgi:heme oxygenase